MGRKKPTARDEEGGAAVGGGKSKKKGFVVDDDEYSIGTELSEEVAAQEEKVAPVGNKKKGKKGGNKKMEVKDEDEEFGDNRVDEEDDEDDAPVVKFTGKKKGKGRKGGSNSTFSASGFGLLGEDDSEGGDEGGLNDDDDEDGEDVVAFKGKKKPSKSKKGGGGFGLLGEDDNDDSDEGGQKDDDEDGEDVVAFKGKKKPSKSKKGGAGAGSVFSSSAFGALSDDEDEDSAVVDDDEEDAVISFSGKKKPSKSKKGGGGFAAAGFDVLNEEEEDKGDDKSSKDEDEDVPEITFAGKKKKSSKGSKKVPENSFSAAVLDEEIDEDISVLKSGDGESDDQDEDISAIKFSGKKKSSKKKKSGSDSALENGINEASSEVTEPDRVNTEVVSKTTSEPVAETSSKNKNKKKKKKGGKAGEEEDDLDKILAEIGGAPSVSQPASTSAAAPPGDNIQSQPDLEGAAATKEAEGPDESVTSKKKKKKKDKEKEKKASAAGPSAEEKQEETKTDVKSKVPEKKVPKHVREMQERLARAEEQRLWREREEEERLRREEEERLRLEELERQAEEKKRLKKEKMKEKIEQKKKDGTYKTAKQKEADKKLEALRLQLLAKSGDLQLGESSRPATKKPLYQKKKSKPQAQSNGAGLEVEEEPKTEVDAAAEAGDVEEAESSGEMDKSEVNYDVKENQSEKGGGDDDGGDDDGDDDDEEWDAKSWDEADLKLPGKSAFSDEEVESEPEALAKELKTAKTASQDVQLRTGATKPIDYCEKITSGVPHRSNAEAAATEGNKVTVNSDTNKSSQIEGGQDLRSPICCIMGHVDTGKTKLLDCIRGTDVQGGEAGGITQQIGATYFPAKNIRDRTKELKADAKLNVPGLLVIDTPGHESFTNLRSRGSGLCDIAILVVDIMHGLEPQTIESLNLLRMRDTEFIVALNKVDRLYGWKTCKNAPIAKAMKQQSKDVQNEFNRRLTEIITEFKMQGLNTELYYKNKEMGETFSIVPTSAISGEGIPDLLLLLVQWTQKTMIERLTFSNEVQCTVLEVKVIEGHGTTIDVVLVNGVLHEGDQVVVCGLQGPIVTSIRALLTPHPMKELRVKGTYLHHKEIKAAQGIKITAQGLEHAIAGTSLYVVGPDDDIEDIKDSAMEDMKSVMSRIDKSGVGVYVQASTLGSLEALLEFLKSPAVSIPVSGISIGPVHKKDVMKASVMLEKNKEYGTILAFDVKVTPEARDLAEELGVKIFIADIIYHLFDQFKAYIDNIKEEKKKEAADEAVFPCVLKIMPNCVFNKKDPIVLGVEVAEGTAKIGTPICVPQKEFIEIGRIASIENNHKAVDFAKKGQKVAIKIIGSNSEEQQKMFGRHFEMEDELVSKISRNSLDALKEHYADDITKDVKQLLFKLKKVFKIP